MQFLFITDPLPDTDLRWDTTYTTIFELSRRGHEIWALDSPQISQEETELYGTSYMMSPETPDFYRKTATERKKFRNFDVIVIRKEPPFDMNYIYMTYLLESVADTLPVINHPRGIRNANEKMVTLNFPQWIPQTVVSRSTAEIIAFQNRLKGDLVLKPLDQKGGKGILLLRYDDKSRASLCESATESGKSLIMAQEFLVSKGVQKDKRILVLNGEILSSYEKRCGEGEFRANLSLGATYHATDLSLKEKEMVRDLKPYLLQEGLYFAGLDVMNEKLIEINVTCPAGLSEAQSLYPNQPLVHKWVNFLEALRSNPASQAPAPYQECNPV